MSAPFLNLDSKLSRAVAAYLVSIGGSPPLAGTIADIFHAYDSRDFGSGLRTEVDTAVARPEVRFSGIYRIPVLVTVVGPSAVPLQALSNAAARVGFDGRLAATFDALMQSDDGGQSLDAMCGLITASGRLLATTGSAQDQLDNADMVDFTVTQWLDDGYGKGEPSAATAEWRKVLLFSAVCCGKNVD